jgi:hypothetical protein
MLCSKKLPPLSEWKNLLPWRWRQRVPLKYFLCAKLHSVAFRSFVVWILICWLHDSHCAPNIYVFQRSGFKTLHCFQYVYIFLCVSSFSQSIKILWLKYHALFSMSRCVVFKRLKLCTCFLVWNFLLLTSEVFLASFCGYFFLIICEMLSGIFIKFHIFLVEIISCSQSSFVITSCFSRNFWYLKISKTRISCFKLPGSGMEFSVVGYFV